MYIYKPINSPDGVSSASPLVGVPSPRKAERRRRGKATGGVPRLASLRFKARFDMGETPARQFEDLVASNWWFENVGDSVACIRKRILLSDL